MNQVRHDEEFAKEAFSRFLATRYTSPSWWEPGSQPPDFWLDVGGRRFAVEVTQVMESIDVGQHTLTNQGANAALRRTVQQLEHEARTAGLLRGFYHVHVCPLPQLRSILQDLRARLFAYLQSTAALPVAAPEELWLGRDGQRWTVEKLHQERDALAESMSLGTAKWRCDILKEIRELLAASFSEKLKKTRSIQEEVILLLIDAYHYADGEGWHRAANDLNTTRFHTVARVYLDYRCQVLSTADVGWSTTM